MECQANHATGKLPGVVRGLSFAVSLVSRARAFVMRRDFPIVASESFRALRVFPGFPACCFRSIDSASCNTLLPQCCCGPLCWPNSDGGCCGSLACTGAVICPPSESLKQVDLNCGLQCTDCRGVLISLTSAASRNGRLADREAYSSPLHLFPLLRERP